MSRWSSALNTLDSFVAQSDHTMVSMNLHFSMIDESDTESDDFWDSDSDSDCLSDYDTDSMYSEIMMNEKMIDTDYDQDIYKQTEIDLQSYRISKGLPLTDSDGISETDSYDYQLSAVSFIDDIDYGVIV